MITLDRKTFWNCWSATIAPRFTEHGLAWKGRGAKLGTLARPDGRNVLVAVAMHGRLIQDIGGEFLVGVAISDLEVFEESRQFNVMPGAVDPRYPAQIKRINNEINARVRADLEQHPAGRARLAEDSISYLLRNPPGSAYRFRDDCDLAMWADQFFASYVPAVLAFARTR